MTVSEPSPVYTPAGHSRKRHYYTKIRVQSQAFPKKSAEKLGVMFQSNSTAFSNTQKRPLYRKALLLPVQDRDRLSYPKNGCSLYASRIFCIAAFGCRDLNSAEPDTRIFAPASVQ